MCRDPQLPYSAYKYVIAAIPHEQLMQMPVGAPMRFDVIRLEFQEGPSLRPYCGNFGSGNTAAGQRCSLRLDDFAYAQTLKILAQIDMADDQRSSLAAHDQSFSL